MAKGHTYLKNASRSMSIQCIVQKSKYHAHVLKITYLYKLIRQDGTEVKNNG